MVKKAAMEAYALAGLPDSLILVPQSHPQPVGRSLQGSNPLCLYSQSAAVAWKGDKTVSTQRQGWFLVGPDQEFPFLSNGPLRRI